MTYVVTGEAVRLDLPPATFASRAVSGVIDVMVSLVALFGGVAVVSSVVPSLDSAGVAAVMVVIAISALIVIPVATETSSRGRTLGKLAMGLRTVRDDGGPVRFRHCLTRGLVGFVEIWLLLTVPTLVCSLFTERGKRLGDIASGCYVIRERDARQAPLMLMTPPHLTGWSRTADVTRLPDGIALSIRQFLSRSHQLHPYAREQQSNALHAAVQPYVGPAPPDGTHPEDFLMAVLTERRDRDLRRLQREEDLRSRLAGVDPIDAALDQGNQR
ncbi:MAG: RDD family protein [Actinomycetota bacterium]